MAIETRRPLHGHDANARRPKKGVVDPQCRVHGIANLYMAGSSVFPTSGFSNPTLTLIALALRLADRLSDALQATRK